MTSFNAYTLETASPEAKKTLQGIQNGYGFIPNLFAYMAEAPVTLEAYLALNQLIAKSSLTPTQAQLALLAVSIENNCDFCTVAHRAMGKAAGVHPETLAALLSKSPIANERERALTEFAQAVVRNRGFVSDQELNNFFAAGFTRQQVFEVILVVTIKTLSNYSNHLTRPADNPELQAML